MSPYRGNIEQLTLDHSIVQEPVKSGGLTEQRARRHPRRNSIPRCLGVESGIEIDYQKRLLLKSTGFH